MTKQEYEWPNCWIRGHMEEKDYQDDSVRLATISCPHRKGQIRPSIFGNKMDYDCHHPAVGSKEEVEGPRTTHGNGFVGITVGGGVDSFKTFCVPVDMHLTSIGEESQLIIEAKFKETPGEESQLTIEEKFKVIPNDYKDNKKKTNIIKSQTKKEILPKKRKKHILEDNTPETADIMMRAQSGDIDALMQIMNSGRDMIIVRDVQGQLKKFNKKRKGKKP